MSYMTPVKGESTSNWTPKETETLVGLTLKYADIIESKISNFASLERKAKTWKEISKELTAATSIKRAPKDILAKYRALKRTTRKDIAEIRNEMKKTGSRTSENPTFQQITLAPVPMETVANSIDISIVKTELGSDALTEEPVPWIPLIPKLEESYNESEILTECDIQPPTDVPIPTATSSDSPTSTTPQTAASISRWEHSDQNKSDQVQETTADELSSMRIELLKSQIKREEKMHEILMRKEEIQIKKEELQMRKEELAIEKLKFEIKLMKTQISN